MPPYSGPCCHSWFMTASRPRSRRCGRGFPRALFSAGPAFPSGPTGWQSEPSARSRTKPQLRNRPRLLNHRSEPTGVPPRDTVATKEDQKRGYALSHARRRKGGEAWFLTSWSKVKHVKHPQPYMTPQRGSSHYLQFRRYGPQHWSLHPPNLLNFCK